MLYIQDTTCQSQVEVINEVLFIQIAVVKCIATMGVLVWAMSTVERTIGVSARRDGQGGTANLSVRFIAGQAANMVESCFPAQIKVEKLSISVLSMLTKNM